MMKKLKFIFLAFLILLITGCATTQNYACVVKSWMGASTKSLFPVWGYPNRKMTLENGHVLYIYQDEEKGEIPPTMFPGYTTVTQQRGGRTVVSTTPPVFSGGTRYDLTCFTWFEVTKSGRIVGTSFRGNDCIAGKDFVRNYTNPKHLNEKY
jgi:hypothetical protein